MSVRCPGCGREYDVTLFQFGRTIDCTCGERVGVEPATRERCSPHRFFADSMVERLARWLRMFGFDCAHEASIDDDDLVRRALEEHREILTRDRSLPEEWRVPSIHLLAARTPLRQLAEVIERFDLAQGVSLLSRCSRCNVELKNVRSEELVAEEADVKAGRLPPADVLESQDVLARCPSCERIYWEGSHTERIRAVAERLLGDPAETD